METNTTQPLDNKKQFKFNQKTHKEEGDMKIKLPAHTFAGLLTGLPLMVVESE